MSLLCLVYGCVIEHWFQFLLDGGESGSQGLKGLRVFGCRLWGLVLNLSKNLVCLLAHVLNEKFLASLAAAFVDGPHRYKSYLPKLNQLKA